MKDGSLRTRFAFTLALTIAIVAAACVAVTAALVNSQVANVVQRTLPGGQAGTSGVSVVEAQADVRLVALGVVGVAVLLAAPLGWMIAERPTRRIENLAFAAAAITAENPGARLPEDGRRDEIDAAARGMNRALDRLSAARAAEERFIANASHELRTPLAAARTALDAPLAQARVPAELATDVKRALTAVRRAEDITAALLRLARTAAPVANTETEAGVVVAASVEPFREDAEAAGRALTLAAEGARIYTDVTLFGQAVANLADNAVRHGAGEVTVTGSAAPGAYRVRVENGGTPLTAAEAARLVEPFYRGAHSRLAGEGSGLGLALVAAIAQRLGGTLTLTAREGGGLIAELTIHA